MARRSPGSARLLSRSRWSLVISMTLIIATLLAACSGSGSSPNPGPDAAAKDAPRSFALALGVDAADPAVQRALAGYDLVVVDGSSTPKAAVRRLQRQGAKVLAYLSVGTLEPGRPWFAQAKEAGWLLERWDDWDEWYAAVDQPGLRRLLVAEAERQLAAGFDGLFLDNTDMVDAHPEQAAGMRTLMAALDRAAGANRQLWAQNGDPVATGIVDHLDGWNREDVSFTYDFDAQGYVPVQAVDRTAAVDQLRRLADRGLVTTATDYLPEVEPALEDEAIRRACGAGARSYVSDIDLTRIPPPRTCA